MALSDSCFDFLEAVGVAASQLSLEAAAYGDQEASPTYGGELHELIEAARAVADNPRDAAAVQSLIFRAAAIQEFYDRPPDASRPKQERV